MAPLFRRLRFRFLKTQQLRKYLLYALGEILLVVIGILIALQVNNWNQMQKNLRKEQFYLKELQMEFRKDSSILDRYIDLTRYKSEDGRRVEAYLKGDSVGKDSLLSYLFFNGRVLVFKSFTPTYDEIIATGQQEILQSDKLKILIKNYKSFLRDLDAFLLEEGRAIKQAYNFHLYQYFDRGILPELWKHLSRKNKYIELKLLETYRMDFEGYLQDTQSLYYASMNTGIDLDLNRIYEDSVMRRLKEVLEELDRLLEEG
jgi:hypothetical protein